MTKLEPGDIFSTPATGIKKWILSTLMSPPTDQFHFGLLWFRTRDGDFVTLESFAPNGLQPGRLSWYGRSEPTFYRAQCSEKIRHKAPLNALDYRLNRGLYDYLTLVKFAFSGCIAFPIILATEHKIRKLKSEDLLYSENSMPYCIEVVATGYDVGGFSIIPAGIAPTPNAMKEAELQGKIIRFTE